jgi:glucosamine-6-phosphate deaminase
MEGGEMDYLKDYMKVKKEDFKSKRPGIEWNIFETLEKQNQYFADYMVKRIQEANSSDEKIAVVLPTGPIDYKPFVEKVNREGVNLKNLHIFMMDDYCKDWNTLIDEDHPLSFRKFIVNLLYESVKPELRVKRENLLFPDPADPDMYQRRIEQVGGLDVVFGGFGLNGHLAFNDPPDEESLCTEDNVKNSKTRVLKLSRETISQNALGGTRGLLELVPTLAITIGMKEMLSAQEVHLYLLRKWHSGIFRRCLFGPVTPKVPGSYLQQHQKVKVHMPEYVAELPIVVVTLDI